MTSDTTSDLNTTAPLEAAPSPLKEYSPNDSSGMQKVELTYQQWEYTFQAVMRVHRSFQGFSALEAAIDEHADQLYAEYGDQITMTLYKPAEDGDGLDTLSCDYDSEHDDLEYRLRECA